MLYLSSILATTLWCTLLIIFRILTVTGVRCGAGGRLRVYYRFIEVLVESSALYSIALVLLLAFSIRNDIRQYYFDAIASIARGVAPTLLVGRAAAGHTRPNEEHDESATVSTLRFQMSSQSSQPSQPSTSSFQESAMQSAVLEVDIEAQPERSKEFIVSVYLFHFCRVSGLKDAYSPSTDARVSIHLAQHSAEEHIGRARTWPDEGHA
ncbi:uncharacterized protein EV420DRAFT_1479644 [Desarmillaria tabescens]|uniref:Uncharacterized protein n=1 Tax=Armillaria tabescens TaxID=1929756 RepID=A0AA39KDI4_ARMTA|nr:uncharacterized protein EV420DRAFT_1479644 [Desarmillaria tabescens]KAK0458997.1 hypothetical protein EV420DRAFT_1479644 [Desarmillaria tabescens]